ncbi:amidohydrolase [Cohnella sp. CFH 77786]|uniref:amidohydrolase n=1 Tax=Cohnella sp. CFH 77786 TaxID=2662265 RepID=UPI001C60B677|nr:amidohydrolase [Cohnella sp. CFH 77786]MBW5449274.1 amidohydrolase [Cohnella sp. CFH 77786]
MSAPAVETLERRLAAARRHLHAHPELSLEEYETTATIRGWLGEADIRIVEYPLKTGVIAEVGGLLGGPVVALRADIDALPVQEKTGLPFASTVPGRMHACGHDFHTAALLGAALLLKERERELAGTVRLIFQPAEEKALGAGQVIASGALRGVQAIFGLHNKPDLPVGTVGIKAGPLMAAADGFAVEVEGRGSHAAVPEAGLDPIVGAAHIVTALQTIVSRNVSPLDSVVLSVTRFQGGASWNVIPDKASFDGTLRTFDEKVRTKVRERFEQVVHGVAAAYGTQASVRWIAGPPAVRNDAGWAETAVRTAEGLGLNVVSPLPSPAGEDFAFYRQQVPGLFVFLGTSGPQEWHHPAFDVDERALPIGAKFLAALAVDAIGKLKAQEATEAGAGTGRSTGPAREAKAIAGTVDPNG